MGAEGKKLYGQNCNSLWLNTEFAEIPVIEEISHYLKTLNFSRQAIILKMSLNMV